MAGTSIDMSKVKQLLQLKQSGMSNRQIAMTLGISRDKANEFVRQAESDPLGIGGLLKLEDPVPDKRLYPGHPAYTDERMEEFLRLLPDFVEQLSRRHVTRQIVWEDYKRMHPDGYGRSQFFYHLSQNLKAQKAPTSVLHHEPGLELYVDFAGDTLSYIDIETGEIIKVQTFVSTLACTDYAFVLCVPSQKTEDFLYALRRALEFYGGVPKIVVPDNLKAAVTRAFTKRSASYYIDRAKSVSEALCALIEGMFASSRANCPPEYYYKTCDMMLRLQRDYNPSYFDKACKICLENSLFTGKKLENVIKTLMQATPEDNWLTAPDPTDHINMRGSLFFQ